MTNVKCAFCGHVNTIADEFCKGCGNELQQEFPPREPEPQSESYEQTAPPPVHNVIRPFDGPGDIIGPTFTLFFKNIWLVTKIVFVIVAPFEVFRAFSIRGMANDWQLMLGVTALQVMCNVLIAPALFYALTKVMETGSAPTVNEAYRWGLSKIPKLTLSAVMSWILIGIGFVLCIIPGIILSLAFQVVYPVAVFENAGPVDVLRRSFHLTEGLRWHIFLGGFVVALVVGACSAPVSMVVALMAASEASFLPLQIVAAIFTDIVAEISTVFALVVYLSILRTLEPERAQ